MCLCPVSIRNPYCGCDPSKGYNYLHDCVSQYIEVPCGHCKDCVTTRQSAYSVRADLESFKFRSVPFMLTLTYNNVMCPRLPAVGDCLDNIPVLCWKHVTDMFKRLRIYIERNPESALSKLICPPRIYVVNGRERSIPSFKYMFVGEYGKNHLRPHYHALLYLIPPYSVDSPQFNIWRNNVVAVLGDWFRNNWAVNVGTRKHPVYKPLYTYIRKRTATGYQSTFDFHAVIHSDTVADSSPMYYVTKYLFKPSKRLEKFKKLVFAKWMNNELSDERFQLFHTATTRNLRLSKFFGFPLDEVQIERVQFSINKSISISKSYPVYFSSSGDSEVFPHYLKRLITPEQATYFAYSLILNNDERQIIKDAERDVQRFRESEVSLNRISDCIRVSDDSLFELLRFDEGSSETQLARSANESFNYHEQSDNRRYFSECSDKFVEGFLENSKIDNFEQLTLFNL